MDHRLGERIALWAPAVVYTHNGCELDATVLDISLSGLGLVINSPTDCPLERFQRVMVDFEPLGVGSGIVVLNAYVARVAGTRVGLMFGEFQVDLIRQVASFVAAEPETEPATLHPLHREHMRATDKGQPHRIRHPLATDSRDARAAAVRRR